MQRVSTSSFFYLSLFLPFPLVIVHIFFFQLPFVTSTFTIVAVFFSLVPLPSFLFLIILIFRLPLPAFLFLVIVLIFILSVSLKFLFFIIVTSFFDSAAKIILPIFSTHFFRFLVYCRPFPFSFPPLCIFALFLYINLSQTLSFPQHPFHSNPHSYTL